jgi:hypothetical protein
MQNLETGRSSVQVDVKLGGMQETHKLATWNSEPLKKFAGGQHTCVKMAGTISTEF